MSIRREDVATGKKLSLSHRVAIESRVWDEWARGQSADNLGPAEIRPGMEISPEMQERFPHPAKFWAGWQRGVLWEYEYLAPLRGKRVLQLGGGGYHALRFLLAGAQEGFCIDPSAETLRLGVERAELCRLSSRMVFIRTVAERTPFPDRYFDIVYGGSVLHHTLLDQCAAEIHRILKPGGRASFHDPLEGNALYRLARKHLPYPGKGEEGVDYPLTYADVHSFIRAFDQGEYREFELLGAPVQVLVRLSDRLKFIERAVPPLDEFMIRHLKPLRCFSRAISIRVRRDQ